MIQVDIDTRDKLKMARSYPKESYNKIILRLMSNNKEKEVTDDGRNRTDNGDFNGFIPVRNG